jgi:hypothetical protein
METKSEFECQQCRGLLRVPHDAIGKQTRCPKCGHIQTIPGEPSAKNQPPSKTQLRPGSEPLGEGPWYVRTPDGAVYGPATFDELQSWVSQGRIIYGCQLRGPDSQWNDATRFFPGLPAPGQNPENQSQLAETVYGSSTHVPSRPPVPERPLRNVSAVGSSSPQHPHPPLEPHRAGLILCLGILGMIGSCPICSLMAWYLGKQDLKKMDAQRMDSTGREGTYAGVVLGQIFTVISLIAISFLLLFWLLNI